MDGKALSRSVYITLSGAMRCGSRRCSCPKGPNGCASAFLTPQARLPMLRLRSRATTDRTFRRRAWAGKVDDWLCATTHHHSPTCHLRGEQNRVIMAYGLYLIRVRTLRLGGLRPSLPRLPVDRCSYCSYCSFWSQPSRLQS